MVEIFLPNCIEHITPGQKKLKKKSIYHYDVFKTRSNYLFVGIPELNNRCWPKAISVLILIVGLPCNFKVFMHQMTDSYSAKPSQFLGSFKITFECS